MNEEKGYYDSFDNTWGKSEDRGEGFYASPTKFHTLYVIETAELILTVVALLGALIQATMLALLCIVIMLFTSIAYLVTVMGLKEFNDLFRVAGLFYLGKVILRFINNLFPDGPAKNLIEVVIAILSLMYTLRFCDGCAELLKNRHSRLVDSWMKYRQYSLYIFVVTVVSTILIYVPILNILAGIAIVIVAVCNIAMLFWHINLLSNTDSVLCGGEAI